MPTNSLALSRLVVDERRSLVRVAQRIVGSLATAEDVAQSLWLKVQTIADDPPILNKRAFLYRLTANVARDRRRADDVYFRTFVGGELPEDVSADIASAEEILLGCEDLALLMRAIDELPPRCREVFLLRKIEELSITQISVRLGIGRSMIARHMRIALRHCLAKVYPDAE